jgi:hypothetical protein
MASAALSTTVAAARSLGGTPPAARSRAAVSRTIARTPAQPHTAWSVAFR